MAQEMQFEDQANRDGQNFSSREYGERTIPSFDGGFAGLHGGKLIEEPRWGQSLVVPRLILAFVSLLIFAGILMVALPIGMNAFTFSLEANFVTALVFLGSSLYLILAFVVNTFFPRRGSLTLAIVALLAFAGIFIVALQLEIQKIFWSMNSGFVHALFILGLILSLTLAIAVNVLFRRKEKRLL